MDLCEESSGDYELESSGDFNTDYEGTYLFRSKIDFYHFLVKDPRQSPDLGSIGPVTDGESSSSIFNLLRGRKFLAAVVTGSSIGKLQL